MGARALGLIRRRPAAILLGAALSVAAACRPPEGDPVGEPLFSDSQVVEVLVEAPELGDPASDRPNRFLRCWRPVEIAGRRVLEASAGGALLQVATLEPVGRTLLLDLADAEAGGGAAHVQARIDTGAPIAIPVTDPLRIELPPDLVPGPHRIEVLPRGTAPLRITGARIEPVSPAGSAHIVEDELIQTGASAAVIVSDSAAGTLLAGDACPSGLRGLRGAGNLSVRLKAANRREAWWSGTDTWTERLGGCRRIELATVGLEGPVRIQFSLEGAGGDIRWRGWRWTRDPPGDEPTDPLPERAPVAATDRPRRPRLVVLYLFDALRADHLGHLGGPEGISPVLDRLAAEGATFRRHWSGAPNTLASIRNLFTGEIWADAASWRRAGTARPTLAEHFQHAGYRTGLFSGNSYVSERFGLARGFEHVSREARFPGLPEGPGAVNRNAEEVHRAALTWLAGLPADARAFLYLHTIHPHNPYAPPEPLARRFGAGTASEIAGDTRTLVAIQRGRLAAAPADRARLRGLYAASVAYNDRELGRLLEALADRFPPDETLVVVTSDHGEELFEHGGVLHGYTLYEELLHVPLVVWGPGTVRSGAGDEPTDALDLHATLVDLVGPPGPTPSAGRSLLPLLTGSDPGLAPRLQFAAAPGVSGGIAAVRDGAWKLIRVGGSARGWAMGMSYGRSWDREYLFDLAADPGERQNLVGTGSVQEEWLRARLRSWLEERRRQGEGRPEEAQLPLDEETERRLRALGYVD